MFTRHKSPPIAPIEAQAIRDELALIAAEIAAQQQAVRHMALVAQGHVDRQAQTMQAAIAQVDRYWVDIQHTVDMTAHRAALAIERSELYAREAKEAAQVAHRLSQEAEAKQPNPLQLVALCALSGGIGALMVVALLAPHPPKKPTPPASETLTTRYASEFRRIGGFVSEQS
jgi:hypothetical protein